MDKSFLLTFFLPLHEGNNFFSSEMRTRSAIEMGRIVYQRTMGATIMNASEKYLERILSFHSHVSIDFV